MEVGVRGRQVRNDSFLSHESYLAHLPNLKHHHSKGEVLVSALSHQRQNPLLCGTVVCSLGEEEGSWVETQTGWDDKYMICPQS